MIKDEFWMNVELFKRGIFDKICVFDQRTEKPIRLHKKQVKALELLTDKTTKFVGYGGAARGGKSLLLCLWQLLLRHAYPNTRGLIGRSELINLERTTLKTLNAVLSNYGFTDADYTHNKQKNFIKFHRVDSEILLMDTKYKPSDNMLIKFGSLEITDAAVDESNETNYKVIEAISNRIGTWNNVKYGIEPKLFESFNPSISHVHRRYWIPFEVKRETENKKFIQALPSDNPGDEAKKWLEGKIKDYKSGDLSEAEYQRLILGNFNYQNDPTLLIKFESIGKSAEMRVLPDFEDRFITGDIAGYGSDSMVIVVWYGFVIRDIVVVEQGGGRTVEQVILKLQKEHNVSNKRCIFDSDGIGNLVGGETGLIRDAKRFVNQASPKWVKKEGIKNLKAFCAYKFAERMNEGGYGFYYLYSIPEYWDRATKEMQVLRGLYLDDDFKTRSIVSKDKMKDDLGFSPDFLDTFIMREYFEYAPSNWDLRDPEDTKIMKW